MVTTWSDPVQFFALIAPIVAKQETRNSLLYGLTRTLISYPTRYKHYWLATVNEQDDEVQVAAVMTPPHPMVIFSNPLKEQAISELVDLLVENEVRLPGVNGPEEEASFFERLWTAKTGCISKLNMHSRAYELTEVLTPAQPTGLMRLAKLEDAETVWRMLNAMQVEAILGPSAEVSLERVGDMISSEAIFVWDVENSITGMAMKTRPTDTSCAISGVYTWPDQRGRGYASALVAGLAQVILNEGKQMATLFTNLANPISNSIYQKIGFKSVCDYRQFDF